LKVSATQTEPPTPDDRQKVVEELLTELAVWKPREQMGAFRSWLRGSLSLIHLHALAVLEAEGPLPMSRLADYLDVSVASATGIVDRMEQRGLVERRHDQEDRRMVVVHSTGRGDAVFERIAEHRRRRLAKVLDHLTDDELHAFLVGIRAMHAARAAMGPDEEGAGDDGTADEGVTGEKSAGEAARP